jgi:hypothetical protein
MARRKFPWLKLTKKSQPELEERPPIWLGNRSNGEYYHQQTREERLIHDETMRRADEQARRLGIERREFLASSMGMFTTLAVINQVSGCGGSSGDGTTPMSPDDAMNMMGGSGAGAGAGGAPTGVAGSPIMAGGGIGGGGGQAAGGMGGAGAGAGGSGGSGGTMTTDPDGGLIECPYIVPPEATCEETGLLDVETFIFDIQTHAFDQGEWRMKNSTYSNFLGFLATCADAGDDQLNCFDEKHYG